MSSSGENLEKFIVDLVLKNCHKLEEILNKQLLPEFIKFHRANPKYNHLKLKQEVLASNAVFFTKKKYALFIINKEGKTVSEYDMKGLILRRSNYPSYTKEKIQILLDMILKTDKIDINEITQYINSVELEVKKLCKEHSKIISGAVNYRNKIEDYVGRAPYQVIGMELWNSLEYKYFVQGSKGYLFRINGINQMTAPQHILNKMNIIGSKNKHIVIPFEEEKLPEYYNINLEEQLKFVWGDRVSEVLSALFSADVIDFELTL